MLSEMGFETAFWMDMLAGMHGILGSEVGRSDVRDEVCALAAGEIGVEGEVVGGLEIVDDGCEAGRVVQTVDEEWELS